MREPTLSRLKRSAKGKLARPKGATDDEATFLGKRHGILRNLRAGHSIRDLAKISGKGISTVQRVQNNLKKEALYRSSQYRLSTFSSWYQPSQLTASFDDADE